MVHKERLALFYNFVTHGMGNNIKESYELLIELYSRQDTSH